MTWVVEIVSCNTPNVKKIKLKLVTLVFCLISINQKSLLYKFYNKKSSCNLQPVSDKNEKYLNWAQIAATLSF